MCDIVDNYYWDVREKMKAGVEHINMGPGKLSVALIQRHTVTGDVFDGKETTAMIADIRYAGIPIGNNADLEVGTLTWTSPMEKQGQTVMRIVWC